MRVEIGVRVEIGMRDCLRNNIILSVWPKDSNINIVAIMVASTSEP